MVQVNYFPSRFDPVRNAEQFPIPSPNLTGKRERVIINHNFSNSILPIYIYIYKYYIFRGYAANDWEGEQLQATWRQVPVLGTGQVYNILSHIDK